APWAIMTGPEGGFAPGELEMLARSPFVIRVGLGPGILRADTAALAALAVFQAMSPRGRKPPRAFD
ncbi:MAG: 16S rRNA (uracil(1498)-N(3))-methyltransferase, partial [Tagaea sp.]